MLRAARPGGKPDAHHVVEAQFKAVARALREAVAIDPRAGGAIPSTKGVLCDPSSPSCCSAWPASWSGARSPSRQGGSRSKVGVIAVLGALAGAGGVVWLVPE